MKQYKYKINGTKFTVNVGDVRGNEVQVEVNGVPYTVELDEEKAAAAVAKAPVVKKAAPAPRTETGERVVSKPAVSTGSASAVKSPLPGTIMSFNVKVGDVVEAGATVCILEAMKMENDIHTSKGGTVTKIVANVGDSVLEGADIMIIE
jgi:biotin carboxyl carrier protein